VQCRPAALILANTRDSYGRINLLKTECIILTPPGRLTTRSYVTPGLPMTQHTKLCRLTVPLNLKVASSEQTMKAGKDSLPSHFYKNHSQNSIRGAGLFSLLHVAVLARKVSTFHAAAFTSTHLMGTLPHRRLWR
jgi:hypothetical protein